MKSVVAPLILVVDDDPTTCLILEGILREVGFRTDKAGDRAEALALIQDSPPDLILLDVTLPDGSGYDICRQLRETPSTSTVPIIFISANDDISAKVSGFEVGGVDYVTKPLAGEEVIARVRTHLRLKRAYESLAQLQAESLQRLSAAQQTIYPKPADFPLARFAVSLTQIRGAGGDFYDVIGMGDTLTDYVVADSCGHDIEASFWTAALKALLQEYASPVNVPPAILQSINSAMERILPEGAFFTLLYARLNRKAGTLSLVSAGHPPAILIPPAGAPRQLALNGDLLGVYADAQFGATEVKVEPGSRFLLYTDGLPEQDGPLEQGIEELVRLCAAHRARPLQDMIGGIRDALLGRQAPRDDILLLGVEV